jgi:signal transduction histidine kinase/CheY-like chemotaxis protein
VGQSLVDALALPACICEAQSWEIIRYNTPAIMLFGRQPAPRTRIHEVLRFVRPDGTPLEDDEVPLGPSIAEGIAAADQAAIIHRPDDESVAVRVDIMPLEGAGAAQRQGLLLFRRAAAGRRHDDLMAGQARALEMIACGAPLAAILDALAREIEAICGGDNAVTAVALAHRSPVETAPSDPTAWSVPILSTTGRPLGSFRTHFRDGRDPSVTERGRVALMAHTATIAIERQSAMDLMVDADRRKDEFVAMLAHELRNPLAPILSAAQLLGVGPCDRAVIVRAGSTIEHHVHHMTHLIDDLLDVSRITRGTVELRKSMVDLREVATRAAESVSSLIDRREHYLSVSLPDAPVVVCVDATRIEQLIANLLTNSAKYTSPGGRIALRISSSTDSTVNIRVTDNGEGIPPALLPRIFDLFTQGDLGLDRSGGGLGIGLTVAKRIVDLHGGSIDAGSDGPGCGSEFTVTLPRGTAEMAGDDGSAPVRPAAQRRILIVEDHRDAGEMLAMLLQMRSHKVRLVSDGYTALAVAPKYRPDVMLIDIGLPGMSGYDLADRIRGDRALAHVLLIAVTGYGSPNERNQALSAGFDHHLVKPVDEDALAALLA